MTNEEKIITGMKLVKEGCKNIFDCYDGCPMYTICHTLWIPPYDWIFKKEN